MLSFVAALLHTSSQERPTERELEERTKTVFASCDADNDGKLTKQDIYNYLIECRVNISHHAQDKIFRSLSGGSAYLTLSQLLQGLSKYHKILASDLEEPVRPQPGREGVHTTASRTKQAHQAATSNRTSSQQAHNKAHAMSAGAALEAALTKISDTGLRPGSRLATEMSCTLKSTMKSTNGVVPSAGKHTVHRTKARAKQAARLASTMKLEKEQAQRAERIRAANLHTAMQPLKQVLHQIDESGSGRMSYHDFYLFLERTNPHMLPAAASIFFTLDKRMDGEIRYKDILRVLYPHALDKELAEMLTIVTRRKQVKGQDNLEQQLAELKEVFAVYDEDGTGQLEQAEFVEAILSAGYEREEALQMFDIVDADHGGSVSLEEFMDWFLHNETGKDKNRGSD